MPESQVEGRRRPSIDSGRGSTARGELAAGGRTKLAEVRPEPPPRRASVEVHPSGAGRRRLRTFRVLAAAAGALLSAVLVLWVAPAVVRAGGGLPKKEKRASARMERRRGAGRTSAVSTPLLPDTGRGALLKGGIGHLRPAELAPRGCLLFATVADVSRTKTRSEELAVAQILRDPAIAPRFASVFEAMRESARQSPKPDLMGFLQMALAAEVDYASARAVFRKEIALIGLPPRGTETVRLAVVAAVGANRDALDDAIEGLMGEVIRQCPQFTTPDKTHGRTRIRSLAAGGFQISFAYYENLFIAATGKDTITNLIDTYEDGIRKQLAGDKVFKQAEEKIGKGADVFYRVDLAGLGKILAAEVDPGAEGFGYSAVPPDAGTLWGSIRLDGEAVCERMFFTGVREDDGSVVSAVTGREALVSPHPKTIGYFSVDTVLYYATTLDPSEAVAQMRKDPKSAKGVSDLVANVGKHLGKDFVANVLGAFGGELALGVTIPPGKPAEILLAFEVKRQDLLEKHAMPSIEKFMAKISATGAAGLKGHTYRDHPMRYVEPPEKVAQPTLIQVLLPNLAYARPKEGEPFLIASSLRALEKAIRQQEHGRSILTEKPGYGRCVGGLRSRRTTLFYADLKGALGFLGGQIPTVAGPAVRGPLARAEWVNVSVPHLFGFAGVVDRVRTNVSMDFYGPLGPMTAVGLASFWRLDKGEGPPAIEEDQKRLRAIGVALHLYATDFDRFPTTLSELHSEYLPMLSDFESSSGKDAVNTKEDIDTRSDYVYISGVSPMDLSSVVVLYAKEYVLEGQGRNILYVDGRVGYVEEAEFQRLMERQVGERAGR